MTPLSISVSMLFIAEAPSRSHFILSPLQHSLGRLEKCYRRACGFVETLPEPAWILRRGDAIATRRTE